MTPLIRSSTVGLCALVLVGCSSPLSEAIATLETGRPDQADFRFRALEPDLADLDCRERTRYALYRGLTHLALGDVVEADRWLSFAKAADRDGRVLSHAERGRLLAAWRTMGRMPGDAMQEGVAARP